jgi:DNA-directed RNA polymerase alpha subunit
MIIKEHTKDFLKFDLHSNTSLCNSLRRIMISDVPTYAIDVVDITENNSILLDEILAHRVGLIPIRVLEDPKGSEDPTDPEYYVSLDVVYSQQLADVNDIHTVYSSDLIYDREVLSIDQDIIVVKLLKGHKVSFDAMVTKGTGYEHAKWCPVSGTTFIENPEPLAGQDPLRGPLQGLAPPAGTGSFTFLIESIGQMDTQDIFLKSIDILRTKLQKLIVVSCG